MRNLSVVLFSLLFSFSLFALEDFSARLEKIYSVAQHNPKQATNQLAQIQSQYQSFNSLNKARFLYLKARIAAVHFKFDSAVALINSAASLNKDKHIQKQLSSLKSEVSSSRKDYSSWLNYIYSIRLKDISEAKDQLARLASQINNFNPDQKARFYTLKAHSAAMHSLYHESIDYADKAISATNNLDLKSKARSIKSSCLTLMGDYETSFLETYVLLDVFPKLKDKNLKGDILKNALVNFVQAKELEVGYELAQKNLAWANKYQDPDLYCNAYDQLSNLEVKKSKYIRAKQQAEKGIHYCQQSDNEFILLLLEQRMTVIAYQLNRLHQSEKAALQNIERLYNSFQLTNEQKASLSSKEKLAIKKFEVLQNVEQTFTQLYPKMKAYGYPVSIAELEISMAEFYLELEQYQQAKELAMKAYEFGKSKNDLLRIKQASELLVRYYQNINDKEAYKQYVKVYTKTSNELNAQVNRRRLAYFKAKNAYKNKQQLVNKNK